MKRAMLPVFLILTMLCCSALGRFSEVDHWVSIEYDFATGENVNNKRYKDGKKEVTRSEGHSKLYKKYGLSHPEPLLVFLHDMGFDKNGKQVASASGGGIEDDYFFRMLEQFDNLPQEEVKAIFAHSVALHKDKKYDEVTAYQRKEYLRYCTPRLKARINKILENPRDMDYYFWDNDNEGWDGGRYFIEHRDEFPELLPYQFYQHVLLRHKNYAHKKMSEFFRAEYRRYPTTMNAFLAAYVNLFAEAEDCFSRGHFGHFLNPHYHAPEPVLFKEYHEAGVLDVFLKTVMLEGLTPVTRMNLPKSNSSKSEFSEDVFWRHVSDLPYGSMFLLWIANAKTLKTHFSEKFEELCQERISKD